jgi:hypothetical protein
VKSLPTPLKKEIQNLDECFVSEESRIKGVGLVNAFVGCSGNTSGAVADRQ